MQLLATFSVMKLSIKNKIRVSIALLLLIVVACASKTEEIERPIHVIVEINNKWKGLSFVGNPDPVSDSCFDAVLQAGSNSITLMPFAFISDLKDPKVKFSPEAQWWGETPNGIDSCVRAAHRKGLRVCLKPQLWVSRGEFTGKINFDSDTDWKVFETSYCNFLLPFLKIAEERKIALFCIGTELGKTVENKPEIWKNIIAFTKKHFNGKLTYAENWDCYAAFPYWSELDYIGVDAYFPLAKSKNPSLRILKKGWGKPLFDLKACSEKWGKPILFTEYGYRSSDWACSKPWEHENELNFNPNLQALAYEALFARVWNQKWFAGGFAWKWFPFNKQSLGEDETEYSPQGKKAEGVLKEFYLRD